MGKIWTRFYYASALILAIDGAIWLLRKQIATTTWAFRKLSGSRTAYTDSE